MLITHVSKKYLWGELILLFIVVPLLLITEISAILKIFFVTTAFVYVLFMLYSYTRFKTKKIQRQLLKPFLKSLVLRIIPIIVFGMVFVYTQSPETFFRLVIQDTKLWVMILFVYSIGSVIPQGIIYRSFFFKRYRSLFSNKNTFITVNAFLFAISHSFLGNWVIILGTFIGGLMFALTYNKTKSSLLVNIEHALYGLVLFTIGIGPYLAFPG